MADKPAWETALNACTAGLKQQSKSTAELEALAEGVRTAPASPEAWQALLQQAKTAGVMSNLT